MNAITNNKALTKYQHPALSGLKDRYLNEVYSLCPNEAIAPGKFLFRAGDKPTHLYLVLDGTGVIEHEVDGKPVQFGGIQAGDYVSLSLCVKDGLRTAALRAAELLTVLALSENILNNFEDHVQAIIFKNLEKIASQSGRRMFLQRRSGDRHESLASGICRRLQGQAELYNNSPSIKEMLANVPRLPPYANKLSSILQETNTSTRTIIEIARQDPSLTAAVMKIINSPYYGLRHKITDFQHAVLLLGFNQIQQLIVNTGIQSTLPNTPEFRQLQFHSIVISALSFEISQIVKLGSPAMLSTLGILHDIGKSVILLLRSQHPDKEFLISQLDPNLIGPMLLKEWQLPDEITAPLEYQAWSEIAPPSALPEEHRVTLAILSIAHLCFIYLQGKNDETTPEHFSKDYMRVLGCQNPSIELFVRERLFPSLAKHSANMPVAMQNLIHTALGRTVDSMEMQPTA
jgi:HD-like signal output (HDOD) protein/CRP-like cAMP-binding protein